MILSTILALVREPYTTHCACCGQRITLHTSSRCVDAETVACVRTRCSDCIARGATPRPALVDRVLKAVGLRRVLRGVGLASSRNA